MKRLKISDSRTVQVALHREIAGSGEARYLHRLHGVLLVCSGMSCREAAAALGRSPHAVANWVGRFMGLGVGGLRNRPHTGRPRTLSRKDRERIDRDLARSPEDSGHRGKVWSGKLLRAHIRRHCSVRLGVRQCQRMLSEYRASHKKIAT